MAMNRIQFQQGLSLPAFHAQFGTEEQCADALEASRWPQGFCCPGCGNADYYLLKVGKHKTFQCKCCRLQTSLIAGTLFQSTHLALSIWFLAIYLVSQAKTGLCRDRNVAHACFRPITSTVSIVSDFVANGSQTIAACFHKPPYDPGKPDFPVPVLTLIYLRSSFHPI